MADKPLKDSLLHRIRLKLRYYSQGLKPHQALLQFLSDVSAKFGVRIEVLYLVLEGLGLANPPAPPAGEYEFRFLTEQDMPEVAAIPGRQLTEEYFQKLLKDGKRCLGIFREGKIVAFTWFDLQNAHIGNGAVFGLKEDEAYLFDAFTAESARGSGLAPYVRYRTYEELAKLGRRRCYSLTSVLNAPSTRFKARLGARILELHFLIGLFGRWRFYRVLKRYESRD